jgi:hypothetical protein
MTEIASAVLRVPLGDFSLVLPRHLFAMFLTTHLWHPYPSRPIPVAHPAILVLGPRRTVRDYFAEFGRLTRALGLANVPSSLLYLWLRLSLAEPIFCSTLFPTITPESAGTILSSSKACRALIGPHLQASPSSSSSSCRSTEKSRLRRDSGALRLCEDLMPLCSTNLPAQRSAESQLPVSLTGEVGSVEWSAAAFAFGATMCKYRVVWYTGDSG